MSRDPIVKLKLGGGGDLGNLGNLWTSVRSLLGNNQGNISLIQTRNSRQANNFW